MSEKVNLYGNPASIPLYDVFRRMEFGEFRKDNLVLFCELTNRLSYILSEFRIESLDDLYDTLNDLRDERLKDER